MPLSGQNILIVETETGPFIQQLQESLESAGAETLVVHNLATAVLRTAEYDFTAVVANKDHALIRDRVELPTLIYSEKAAKSVTDTLVSDLKQLLVTSI